MSFISSKPSDKSLSRGVPNPILSLFVLFLSCLIEDDGPPSKYCSHGRLSSGRPKRPYIPTLSRMRHCLSPFLRRPRPTCWIYFTKERVGRANWTNSRSGQSKPSENISTLTMMSRSPFLKFCTSLFLSCAGVSLSMSAIFIPASRNWLQMCLLCFLDILYIIPFFPFTNSK